MAVKEEVLPEIRLTLPKEPPAAPATTPERLTSPEAKGTVVVEIAGNHYKDFVAFSYKRSAQETAGSGTLVLSWPGAEMFNAVSPPGQAFLECSKGHLYLDGQLAATFRVWARVSHGTPNSFTLTIQLMGIPSDAVLSHPLKHPTGEENKKTPKQIMDKALEGLDTKVIDISGFTKQIPKFIFGGETIDRLMRRATRNYGLRYVERPDGNLRLQKVGHTDGSGQALKLGRNFTEWSVKRDVIASAQEVFLRGNGIPDDKKYGKPNEEIAARVKEPFVKCPRRANVLMDTHHDPETLKKATAAEAERRKAMDINVTLKLSTWSDDNGELWAIDKTHHVTIPVDQLDDDLIVDSVQFDLTKNTRTTTMVLVSHNGSTTGKAPGGSPFSSSNYQPEPAVGGSASGSVDRAE